MVKKNTKFKLEKVYSPIFDKHIERNVNGSPIWNEAHHVDEIGDVKKPLTEYSINFDGLKPIQVTNIKKFVKK